MVRTKMQLVEVTSVAWNPFTKRLKFSCYYDPSIPEDDRFQKATPSGDATFLVDNPTALERFEIGKFYYVGFEAVPEPAKG